MVEQKEVFLEEEFDERDNSDDNNDESTGIWNLAELLETEKLLENLLSKEEEAEIDISTLNRKRNVPLQHSPKTGYDNEIKIGSLEVTNGSYVYDVDACDVDKFALFYLNYFAFLGQDDSIDEFNYEYIDILCKRTDVNQTDIHGQTVMHEIARDWNTDVAYFLKTKGVKIDIADKWGRTPLFVAVAANNTKMVQWLIENGADKDHHTLGEGQYPLHYAAKYDAIEVASILLELGANPLGRDSNNRTPFYVAAELGVIRMCRYFLDMELPTASYADNGEALIDHIISNLPFELINKALDQYISNSLTDTNEVNLHLSCLGKRRWRNLRKKQNKGNPSYVAPSALEFITEKKECDNLNHPVIVQLIELKRKQYGNTFFLISNSLNLLFTVLWTISATIKIGSIAEPLPNLQSRYTIFGITIAAQILTFVLMYKLYLEWKVGRGFVLTEKKRRGVKLYKERRFCHPRWIREVMSLERRVKMVQEATFYFWSNGWILIEILCFILACVFTILTVLWYLAEENMITFNYQIRMFYSAFFVLVVWIRLNRCFKYHQTFGSFVAMLEECAVASAQIGFLFLEFYVPFAVAFWVAFGGVDNEENSSEYATFNDLLYQLWLLTFIGDYDFDSLVGHASLIAQIFVGLFLLVVSIITLNIYIALLSEAFARVNEDASQRAYMEEARIYNNIERIFPDIKVSFETYVDKHCAPMVIGRNHVSGPSDGVNARSIVIDALKIVREMKSLMTNVVDDEGNVKKDVDILGETFCSFQNRYTEKLSREMTKDVRKILDKESHLISRKVKSAVSKYIEWIRRKYRVMAE